VRLNSSVITQFRRKEAAVMEEKKKNKKTVIAAILFPLIAAIMLYLVFRGCDFASLNNSIKAADTRFVILAVICICGFVLCESVNIGRIIRASGYHIGFIQMITYGASGFFFSGVTPSSSGGQPMQLLYMTKDRIRASHGSLSLIVEVAGFQVANIILALFGVLYNIDYIRALGSAVQIFIAVGIGIDAAVLVILLLLIFNERASVGIEKTVLKIMWLVKKKERGGKIAGFFREYRDGAGYIKRHPSLIAGNLVITFVQLLAMYSITYFIYLALGCTGYSWANVFSLQAVLSAAIASVPLPGAVGAGESGFKLLFSSIFAGGMLMPGMLLSRGISFYLGLLITGGFLLALMIIKNIRKTRKNTLYEI